MGNILPAITFVLAWIFGLEKVNFMSMNSQAKILGTVATIGGAMIMTLVRGPIIQLPWTEQTSNHAHQIGVMNLQDAIKGALFITVGCFSWGGFMILQAVTLRTYPADLSFTAWICGLGTAEGAIVALIMERGKPAVWSINWDIKLLAALYSGVLCSGLAYYIQGIVMKERGPVFVTSFSPLGMVIVAVLSSFILREILYLGRLVGAMIIVAGVYLVVWGKRKDHKSSTMEIQETGDNQMSEMTDANSKSKENLIHEVIEIDIP